MALRAAREGPPPEPAAASGSVPPLGLPGPVALGCGLRVPGWAWRHVWEVALDPAGFAQTVENLHALSHLFRDSALLVSGGRQGRRARVGAALCAAAGAASKGIHVHGERNGV